MGFEQVLTTFDYVFQMNMYQNSVILRCVVSLI